MTAKVHTQGSNNTNKLSPQERSTLCISICVVQIIQINLVLKNEASGFDGTVEFK